MSAHLLQQAALLNIDEKIELDNRLSDYLENSDKVLSWQEVKQLALVKIKSLGKYHVSH